MNQNDLMWVRKKSAVAVMKLGQKCEKAGVLYDTREPIKKGWQKSLSIDVFYNQDKLEEAIAYYEVAAEIDRDCSIVNTMAIVHEMLGNFEKAVDLYKEMVGLAEKQGLDMTTASNLGVASCEEHIK